jgi:hypothetical protein
MPVIPAVTYVSANAESMDTGRTSGLNSNYLEGHGKRITCENHIIRDTRIRRKK